jgi:hypothetical protein
MTAWTGARVHMVWANLCTRAPVRPSASGPQSRAQQEITRSAQHRAPPRSRRSTAAPELAESQGRPRAGRVGPCPGREPVRGSARRLDRQRGARGRGYAAGAAGAPPYGHAAPTQAGALDRPARRHDLSTHPRYPSLGDHHGRKSRPPGPAVTCGIRSRRVASCRWGARRGHLEQPLNDPPLRRLRLLESIWSPV